MKNQSKSKASRPKVVLDTNIYVSGFGFGGLPWHIFRLAEEKEINAGISHHILLEFNRIIVSKLSVSSDKIEDMSIRIEHATTLLTPKQNITVLSHIDESDNRILEVAVTHKAQVVVSGDRDLLDLGQYEGILIMTPRDFLLWLSTHR